MAKVARNIYSLSIVLLVSVALSAEAKKISEIPDWFNTIKQKMTDYAQDRLGEFQQQSPGSCTPKEFAQLVSDKKRLEDEKSQLVEENNSLTRKNNILAKNTEFQKKISEAASNNADGFAENNQKLKAKVASLEEQLQHQGSNDMAMGQLQVELRNLQLHYKLLESDELSVQDKDIVQRQMGYLKQGIADIIKAQGKEIGQKMLMECGYDKQDSADIIGLVDGQQGDRFAGVVKGAGAGVLVTAVAFWLLSGGQGSK